MARMFPLILMQMFGDNVSSELCLQIEPFFRPFEACRSPSLIFLPVNSIEKPLVGARIYEVNP
jgi:hypothetical protein